MNTRKGPLPRIYLINSKTIYYKNAFSTKNRKGNFNKIIASGSISTIEKGKSLETRILVFQGLYNGGEISFQRYPTIKYKI